MQAQHRRTLILLSPVLVLGAGHLTARIAGPLLGVQAWLPVNLVLWSMFALFVFLGGGRESMARWLGPSESPGWGWRSAALLVALIPLPVFLQHWRLLEPASIWIPWVLFALINPVLEETYWRGLLLDHTRKWPAALSVLYSSVFFALNHPLSLGLHSVANRHPATFLSTLVMGLVWAITYRKTLNLRVLIVAHAIVDLLNLSIPAFLNLYVPPGS